MLLALGIGVVFVVLLICGGSPLDEERTEEQRLDLGVGIFVFTVVIALVVALIL